MTSCLTPADPFQCPAKWDLWRQILSLLPRGRAWQTHEQVFEQMLIASESEVGEYEVGVGQIGVVPVVDKLTVMQQFWAAYAEVLAEVHVRACALLDEMYCDTVAELRNEWLDAYGLPDECGPWRTLCEKVNAVGGSSVDYLIGLGADLGWVVEVTECDTTSITDLRAGHARAGCARTCACPRDTIFVNVLLSESPAFSSPRVTPARAGNARAGAVVAAPCPPGAEAIVCLINRFKQAHIKASFSFDGVPQL